MMKETSYRNEVMGILDIGSNTEYDDKFYKQLRKLVFNKNN